jgi:hypothetical protein
MKKIPCKKIAMLGLASACAAALLWTHAPVDAARHALLAAAADPSSTGAGGAPDADPHAPVRLAAAVAPVPRNAAQAKLGSGQLLQAVQWFAHNAMSAAGGSGGPALGAAYSATSVAAQIAALDRAGLPAAYRDGEKVKINIRLALPYAQIADAGLLDRATSGLRETMLAAGLEARAIAGSPTLEALVPLARLESVAALAGVAQIRLMTLPDLKVTSDGLDASGVSNLRALANYGNLAVEFRDTNKTVAIIDKFGSVDLQALQLAKKWPKNTQEVTDKLVQINSAIAFGSGDALQHGDGVVQYVYGVAPKAKFRLYDIVQASDWGKAVRDAANLDALNQVLGAPRARLIGLPLEALGESGTGVIEGLSDAIAAATANGAQIIKSSDSESLEAFDGTDKTVAIIDRFSSAHPPALQLAGKWPTNTEAVPDKLVQIAGTAVFGSGEAKHGNEVVEDVYGLAPNAKFRVYDIRQASDWVGAVRNAANLDTLNRALGEPRAQLIGLPLEAFAGSGGVTIPGLSAAIAAATANGVQIVKSSGKELRGENMAIAIIDTFDSSNIAALQNAGEWPNNSATVTDKLVLTASADGVPFGASRSKHGNAVTEIVYDIAPDAKYRLYDTSSGIGGWVRAVQDAANLNAFNQVQGEPRVQVISVSMGVNGASSGDGTGEGSDLRGLYEAISAANANGVLVINAAGNEARSYWDGESSAGAGNAVAQDFVRGNRDGTGREIIDDINILRRNASWGDCVPVGIADRGVADRYAFNLRMTWNNWSIGAGNTTADYRLELVRWADQTTTPAGAVMPAGWVVAAQSDNAQTGAFGQTPSEGIDYAAPVAARTARCDNVLSGAGSIEGSRYAGGGMFGVRIVRKSPNTANFLRLFTDEYQPRYSVSDRSLIAPADSADVISVAALAAATSGLEAYSSRGPILAPGGAPTTTQAVGNAKPDLANFANVDTVSYGNNAFNGTSSATPHVAALALLGLQHQMQLANATKPAPTSDAVTLQRRRNDLAEATYGSLLTIAGTGGNDLGPAGFDSGYGSGRLKFHAASKSCFLSVLYSESNRALLPAQANPLPPDQKSYSQLLAQSSEACAAR